MLSGINSAFAAVDVNSKTAADLQVEANQSGKTVTIEPTSVKPDGQVPDEQPVDEDWDKEGRNTKFKGKTKREWELDSQVKSKRKSERKDFDESGSK